MADYISAAAFRFDVGLLYAAPENENNNHHPCPLPPPHKKESKTKTKKLKKWGKKKEN